MPENLHGNIAVLCQEVYESFTLRRTVRVDKAWRPHVKGKGKDMVKAPTSKKLTKHRHLLLLLVSTRWNANGGSSIMPSSLRVSWLLSSWKSTDGESREARVCGRFLLVRTADTFSYFTVPQFSFHFQFCHFDCRWHYNLRNIYRTWSCPSDHRRVADGKSSDHRLYDTQPANGWLPRSGTRRAGSYGIRRFSAYSKGPK